MLLELIILVLAYKILETIIDYIRFKDVSPNTVVLITGGCQGLGKELALKYASFKCKVAIWDVCEDLFPVISSQITGKGGTAYTYKCDISCPDQVAHVTRLTLTDLSKVDILINNAAIANHYLFKDLPVEKFTKLQKINLIGQFIVTKQFLGIAKNIVVIASVLSKFPAEHSSDYCASKHGVDAVFSSLRLEMKSAGSNVKITVVHPAHMKTDMFKGYFARIGRYVMDSLEPNEVANKVYRAICLGKEEIYLPYHSWVLIFSISLLPAWIRDRVYILTAQGIFDNIKPN